MYIPNDAKFINQSQRRWNRVLDLLHHQEPGNKSGVAVPNPYGYPTPRDDDAVKTAFTFMMELRAADADERKQQLVAARHPALYRAYLLKTVAPHAMRDAIEGLLVAKMGLAKIAEVSAVSVSVIEWYRKLWFDVGDVSAMQVTTVLAPEIHDSSFSADATGPYWKVVGACGGVDMLMSFLTFPTLTGDQMQDHRAWYRSNMARIAIKALSSVPMNSYTLPTVLETHTQMEKAEADVEAAIGAGQRVTGLMEILLKNVPWGIFDTTTPIPRYMHDDGRQTRMIESTTVAPDAPRSPNDEQGK